jgi:fumarate reductase subunit C
MSYRPAPSVFWWVRRRAYIAFVLRELSSLFVAWFVGYLLLLVHALDAGSEQYRAFLRWADNPWVLAVNTIALLFLILHAITWFRLAPQAMVVRLRGRRVRPVWIAAANYALWAAASAVVFWIIVSG